MGLPGAGKTYFAERLKQQLESFAHPINEHSLLPISDARVTVAWLNADEVRRHYNDWDFSTEGRIRQSNRMRDLADESNADYCIVDFVAPLIEMRNNFRADWTIWIDTIDRGRFEDTNRMFVPPEHYDFRITEQNAEKWVDFVAQHITERRRRPTFDWQRETVQMLGRWQPWHAGHRALFERAIKKTGQVCIMIRDCQGWQGSNPFAIEQVKNYIRRDLDPLYQGQYEIVVVPNIVNITYGRDVGYTIEQETFDESITSISATAIRNAMGLK
jgi:hypothetical protein